MVIVIMLFQAVRVCVSVRLGRAQIAAKLWFRYSMSGMNNGPGNRDMLMSRVSRRLKTIVSSVEDKDYCRLLQI